MRIPHSLPQNVSVAAAGGLSHMEEQNTGRIRPLGQAAVAQMYQ